MLGVIRLTKLTFRWSDCLRNLFYETLALQCIGLLWVIAWANALEARVKLELEPHDNEASAWMVQHPQAAVSPPAAVADTD